MSNSWSEPLDLRDGPADEAGPSVDTRSEQGTELIDRVERRRAIEPMLVDEEPNYEEFLAGAAHAALTLGLVQIAAAVFIAQWMNISIAVRFWFDLIPHLAFVIPERGRYVQLTTWTVLVSGTVTLLGVLWNWFIARHRTAEYVAGWRIGVPMVLLLGLFNMLRDLLDPPTIEIWPVLQVMAAAIAAGLFVFGIDSRAGRTNRSVNEQQPTKE